ncbi:MAG: hypothetical protein G8D24_00835 [Buchnera aphidicola (Periphyllus lyropictus)]|uniref:FlgK family flagellar hook-associated protein n=1 Tax=Buchnera aphidicola TaxID=9 RepID=UPI001EB63B75|nr:hypothetical protein [Buchnera aphidicola]NIH16598.1 hypothetical protein [Buchnera aphidicola (Periphyllus lyropictus)]USS94488.1 hypothetical protein M5J13_01565 [Buchnera aphidicola (Periphyllus lyropictus)]
MININLDSIIQYKNIINFNLNKNYEQKKIYYSKNCFLINKNYLYSNKFFCPYSNIINYRYSNNINKDFIKKFMIRKIKRIMFLKLRSIFLGRKKLLIKSIPDICKKIKDMNENPSLNIYKKIRLKKIINMYKNIYIKLKNFKNFINNQIENYFIEINYIIDNIYEINNKIKTIDEKKINKIDFYQNKKEKLLNILSKIIIIKEDNSKKNEIKTFEDIILLSDREPCHIDNQYQSLFEPDTIVNFFNNRKKYVSIPLSKISGYGILNTICKIYLNEIVPSLKELKKINKVYSSSNELKKIL